MAENKTIKNNIGKYLNLAGLTQKELAERIRITETSISRYVNGERIPNAIICIRIAEGLNCKVEDLFREECYTDNEELQAYKAIGTVEEFKTLKEKQYNCTIKHLTNECSYKETGCSDCKGYWEIRKLLEKSVAKKPRFYAHNYYCTECGNLVGNNEFEWQRFLYCDECGQKLDWQ